MGVLSAIAGAAVALSLALAPAPAQAVTETEGTMARILQDKGFGPIPSAAIIANVIGESDGDPSVDYSLSGQFNWPYEQGCGLFGFTDCGYAADDLVLRERSKLMEWAKLRGWDWSTTEAQMEYVFGNSGGEDWKDNWLPGLAESGYYWGYSGVRENMPYDATPEEFMAETRLDVAVYSWMACYGRGSNAYNHFADGMNEDDSGRLGEALRIVLEMSDGEYDEWLSKPVGEIPAAEPGQYEEYEKDAEEQRAARVTAQEQQANAAATTTTSGQAGTTPSTPTAKSAADEPQHNPAAEQAVMRPRTVTKKVKYEDVKATTGSPSKEAKAMADAVDAALADTGARAGRLLRTSNDDSWIHDGARDVSSVTAGFKHEEIAKATPNMSTLIIPGLSTALLVGTVGTGLTMRGSRRKGVLESKKKLRLICGEVSGSVLALPAPAEAVTVEAAEEEGVEADRYETEEATDDCGEEAAEPRPAGKHFRTIAIPVAEAVEGPKPTAGHMRHMRDEGVASEEEPAVRGKHFRTDAAPTDAPAIAAGSEEEPVVRGKHMKAAA